jgi:hypothetical protein
MNAPNPTYGVTLDLIERALVGSVLATHPAGVAVAHSEGVDAALIESDDLRALMCAAETCRDCEPALMLAVAKRGLIHVGQWGGQWSDESLVTFAAEYRDAPVTREAARMLAGIHAEWASAIEEHGPMYQPPVAFGALNPIRTGLALAKLSRLAGLPVEWIQARFAQICQRQDDVAAANRRRRPLVVNANRGAA